MAGGFPLDSIELAVQRKKINEVFAWFKNHFTESSHVEYIKRCPLIIFQGPTGCGKTLTLSWIARELKVPVKEYSETTDLTAINFELAKSLNGDHDNNSDKSNLSHTIDRRKAMKFEHFIVNSLRYNTLYSNEDQTMRAKIDVPVDSDAEAEFDDDDDTFFRSNSLPTKPSQPDTLNGVIIHIETPLTFARNQRILIQTVCKLIKAIREVSKTVSRRLAIVFETLEGDASIISLPTKLKTTLGIQTFKFNPATKTNMKRLVDFVIKQQKNFLIDKETIEQIVNDSDGDVRACLNTLQLICNKSQFSFNLTNNITTGILNQHNGSINNNRNFPISSFDRYSNPDNHITSQYNMQASKRQKLDHANTKIRLTSNLLRDNTRSISFFHVLGKIFYQKRLYPDLSSQYNFLKRRTHINHEFDRPYPTANTTEEIVDLLDIEAKNLLAWLHQHYHKFCNDQNIDKAALFLENQSTVDTISLASTQSTQFYEMQSSFDKIQLHLAIDSTFFSLYEDLSKVTPKSSHKKVQNGNGIQLIKSSVECSTPTPRVGEDSCSFKKPTVMSLHKIVGDYSSLLDICTSRMFDVHSYHIDSSKLLEDYIPYLNQMSTNWSNMSPSGKLQFRPNETNSSIFQDDVLTKLFKTLNNLEIKDKHEQLDYDARHEQLLEFIEEIELQQTGCNSTNQDRSRQQMMN